MQYQQPEQQRAWIVGFCRYARTHGLSIGVTETLVALEAVRTMPELTLETFQL